jgi:succinate dehydrogenase / fumarate reductase, membrane anchor subunit
MNNVTKKWVFLKASSVVLIPLMAWFIISLVSVFDKNYIDIVGFFSKQPSKFLFSLFVVFAYFFSALSISEVFEDYIKNEKIKNAANKAFNIFAIIMPLITIIIIFNLKHEFL